jgi:3-deoxy-D-manno-octulosonic-acid transferase
LKWLAYNLLFLAVYPFLLPGYLLRMLRRGGYAARMGDRFALYPERIVSAFKAGEGKFVWIHAVSVGEVQVAAQFMREWRRVEKDVRFCFSTTSSTGWRIAEREIAEGDILIYNPLDFPSFVKSALKLVKPRAVVLVESEIWPVFIRTAKKYRIPVFLVNARVSDRSAPRYRKARWFFKDVFSCFAAIFAQSQMDRRRLVDAGAPESRVHVTGSFKFDAAHRAAPEKESELRKWTGEGRILLGGSTWPGEDEVLIDAYSKLRARDAALKLVIAPRHFEKADAVEANIVKAGFKCVRRSRGEASGGDAHEVLLADTTGELMGFYGIADAVFVGKSLCAHGSQNMIEPCLCAKPVIVGPYTENFRPVMDELLADDAIVQVDGAGDVVSKLEEMLFGGGELGKRAAAAVESRRGVVAKCVERIRGVVA